MMEITETTCVADVVKACPSARNVFDRFGLRGCGGEHGPAETLALFAAVHQVDVTALVQDLDAELRNPDHEAYVYRESLGDYIHRRFFKAGIAIVLSVGALWGAVTLLQIAQGGTFLQVRLVPAIQAHAHAMIFGWMGLFVMGFAYQSFPRFKFVALWRPDLANLTLYLMLVGIAARVGAELLQPMPVGVGLGILAAAAELAAITLFILIILKTAKQTVQPHQRYEKFIFGAFFWFFVQAIVSDVLFFAKVTAASADQLVMRIVLIDGPLRDIQLLGFGALIIAGVSQRFVPAVYGLGNPRRDRQSLIFWLINGSLLLDVASYVLLFSTGNLYFSAGLELAFILMALWAILLVGQLRVFVKNTQGDRSLKFIRAAYAWLLVSMAMLPFFLVYSGLTHQGFSHAFLGSYRHAYTVGFVSMMILGVASRVVPILAGADSHKLSSLWGPFLLFNVGCGGRVVLQILTDFIPQVAYRLVGITGFIEVSALVWGGVELWHTMNLSLTHRARLLHTPVPLSAR
ncbi:MAG TPA: NnrS family protein [Terriglobia bacterium]|nr:NnrS family protein [Terriglobia bacterium]